MAARLSNLGVSRGDCVACYLPNVTEWVVTNLATAYIGAILVGVNTWYKPDELSYALSHSEAAVLVMTGQVGGQDCVDVFVRACGSEPSGPELQLAAFPKLKRVVYVGEESTRPQWAIAWTSIVTAGAQQQAQATVAAEAVQPNDIADILYTSGSTARPKGVTLAHGHLIENGWHIGARLHLGKNERVWLANPLFFSYGCANALMVSLTHRACMYLQRTFNAAAGLKMLEEHHCTVLYGSTNMILTMLRHPDFPDRDLSALRTGTATGLPAHIMARVELGAEQICNAYGMTETYGHFSDSDALGDSLEVRLNASGRPLPGNEIRIIDVETESPAPPGEIGEIRVRGRVTPGYHKAPEMTREARDADGYFKTGDLGWVDTDGQVHWHARLTEMIKTGGLNVAPAEVEDALVRHPLVDTACVFGLPDKTRGEIVCAVVSFVDGASLDESRLRGHCSGLLSSYKVPKQFVVMSTDRIPLTPTGKVWRQKLQEMYTNIQL
jgi:fatty-acyl-CoA synthase